MLDLFLKACNRSVHVQSGALTYDLSVVFRMGNDYRRSPNQFQIGIFVFFCEDHLEYQSFHHTLHSSMHH